MKNTYAIVKIHGRQYKVSEGDKIKASYIDAEVGTKLPFSEVVFLNKDGKVQLGAPTVKGAKVNAQVESHGRHEKILVFKYLRKNKSKKLRGHRQPFTTLSITGIEG